MTPGEMAPAKTGVSLGAGALPFSAALEASRRRARRQSLKVALVSMPFASVRYPSIQIGLLKSIALKHGFSAETFHLNLDFAARIGARRFEQLATFRGPLFGDWIFGKEAFPEDPDPELQLPGRYPSELRDMFEGDAEAQALLKRIRTEDAPAFLDEIVERTPWHGYDVVGFTSTFQQTTASVALARRLKARWPHLVTIFGGANFDGDMGKELVRSIPVIDYSVTGEGDATFPRLLDAILDGQRAPDIPGVVHRRHGEAVSTVPPELYDRLSENPPPDYDEYFERAADLGLVDDPARRLIDIPFESSRGCWWGQKHHCTFCGLNGQSMRYRSKPIEQLLDEIGHLSRTYRSFRFVAVDNIIDHTYLNDIAARFADRMIGTEIFYEIKANLTRGQIEGLSRAGITRIQPGIESLSTPILKLMRKGITGIQNVTALKWAYHYGIRVSWNILWGFPGEDEAAYQRQRDLVKALRHIPPPSTWGRIWLERFSPIFQDAARYPRNNIAPHGSYRFVYSRDVDVEKVAYFFEGELDNTLPDESFLPLSAALELWRDRWTDAEKPSLRYWWTPGELIIEDKRDRDANGSFVLEGPIADVYHKAGDKPQAAAELAKLLDLKTDWLQGELDQLVEAGVMMEEAGRYLSLGLPARPALGQEAVR